MRIPIAIRIISGYLLSEMMKRLRNAQLKNAVIDWVEQDGTRLVRRRLKEKGLSHSTVEKITLGKYDHELGNLISDKIREALEERRSDKAS